MNWRRLKIKLLPAVLLSIPGIGAVACTSHHIDVNPIEIRPIRITVDVNVKVQRELDDFFDFEEDTGDRAPDATTETQPSPQEGK